MKHLLKESVPLSPVFSLSAAQLQRYSRALAWLFFALMVLIGSVPGKAEALSAATHDKFLHFFAYSVLSFLIYAGLSGNAGKRALGTVLFIALLGGVDETIQYLLPYRNSDATDWLFNMMAAALSAMLSVLLHRAVQHRRLFTGRRRHASKNDRTN